MSDAITIDHDTAATHIEAFAREGRLVQGTWHRRDGGDDGRELACLLGAIHPSIGSAEACPASLMPRWLAYLTVRLFDGVASARIAEFALGYAERLHRWGVIDEAGWGRVRRAFITEVLGGAMERWSARVRDPPPPLWAPVTALHGRLMALLLGGNASWADYRSIRDEAYGLRAQARRAWHAAVARHAAAAEAEAAVVAVAVAEAAAVVVAVAAAAAVVAAAVAAEAVVAAAVAAEAEAEAAAVAEAAVAAAVAVAVARRSSYAASFETLLRLIDAEIAAAWPRGPLIDAPSPGAENGGRAEGVREEFLKNGEMMMMTKTYRQGDIMLRLVTALPQGVEIADRDKLGRIVLARGERHDHTHAIHSRSVCGFRVAGSEDVAYIEVGGVGAPLTHEYSSGVQADHDPINLAPGVYHVVRQREYVAPQIERRVVD